MYKSYLYSYFENSITKKERNIHPTNYLLHLQHYCIEAHLHTPEVINTCIFNF